MTKIQEEIGDSLNFRNTPFEHWKIAESFVQLTKDTAEHFYKLIKKGAGIKEAILRLKDVLAIEKVGITKLISDVRNKTKI